ncbi:MAG: DUF389 domain-containing protein [Alphaproteobacteria bacterium]|nr:DUF389 domain-containing protein [Alphaproteobacteria bacterium]
MKKKLIDLAKSLLFMRERDFVLAVNHKEVISSLTHDARFTVRYIFMIIISISIATMGIILDDMSVIVGAMLISPMMSPIVLLGFSICRVNYTEFLHSIRSIIIGIFVAILFSFLIVKISPVHEVTDVVLSATKANIYNLLVALFSGAAGAYTKIKRKGEEIIGVAIASSLMPPLSVIGFSIATGHYDMAQEAAFLFITNLIAIALAGTILARWYGFGFRVSKIHLIWQISIYSIAILILSVPLVITLKKVAYELKAQHIIHDTIHESFGENAELNIEKIHFPNSLEKPIKVSVIVFTNKFRTEAEKNIKNTIASKLAQPISLKLDQVLYSTTATPEKKYTMPTSEKNIISMVRESTHIPIRLINVNMHLHSIEIFLTPSIHQSLKAMHAAEIDLRKTFSGWTVRVIPPTMSIPVLYFGNNKTTLDTDSLESLKSIIWLLDRWQVYEVTVTGFSNNKEYGSNENPPISAERVNYIVKKLSKNGIKAIPTIEHRDHPTRLYNETDYGVKNENKVLIRTHSTRSLSPTKH